MRKEDGERVCRFMDGALDGSRGKDSARPHHLETTPPSHCQKAERERSAVKHGTPWWSRPRALRASTSGDHSCCVGRLMTTRQTRMITILIANLIANLIA